VSSPACIAIGNLRAEPTTEYVETKSDADVQPYTVGSWSIVHNGTLANDKELCAKYGFTPNTRIDSWVIAALCNKLGFEGMLNEIIGSFAIIAINEREPDVLYFAMNYRPLYKSTGSLRTVSLSSVPIYPEDTLLPPYSYGMLHTRGVDGQGNKCVRMELKKNALYKGQSRHRKALVVCSGGLDSTVAAAKLVCDGFDVELLHFDYGARATGPERIAVEAVAKELDVPLNIISTSIFTDVIKGSRLTNTKDEAVAQNEAGAEYAHEWVPARNLILSSIALGIAESRGFDVLALGANLEEAGAYPDNEPEFLRQFNKLIPFAVSDGKRITVETPVGNLMKHEIVALGLRINAPMELTWSCYDATMTPEGTYQHCGHCGPCFMRKTAFRINGAADPVMPVGWEVED